MKRIVRPELLDRLAVSDPQAIGSRADLRKLNLCMDNARIAAEALAGIRAGVGPRRVIELGAGEAFFTREVLKRLGPDGAGRELVLVDRQGLVSATRRQELRALGWKVRVEVREVFEFMETTPESDMILANLFLHHFPGSALLELFQKFSRKTGAVVAIEPRRAWKALIFSRMVGIIGCNAVTRHDAPVSVRAGFAGTELSALWPEQGKGSWRLQERKAGRFSHLFVARKE